MTRHRKVLIPLNGSLKTLREGLKIAESENCWATVLKVVPPYGGDIDLTGVKNIREVLDGGRREVRRSLMEAVRDESAARVRVEQGGINETINRVAAEEECNLIILGVKKDGGPVRRLLDGNLVKRVADKAPCPVLVVDA